MKHTRPDVQPDPDPLIRQPFRERYAPTQHHLIPPHQDINRWQTTHIGTDRRGVGMCGQLPSQEKPGQTVKSVHISAQAVETVIGMITAMVRI